MTVEELLHEMGKLTGGLGFTIKTIPISSIPDKVIYRLRWRTYYKSTNNSYAFRTETSSKRTVYGDTLQEVLETALRYNREIESCIVQTIQTRGEDK